jgi:hypothetical protein
MAGQAVASDERGLRGGICFAVVIWRNTVPTGVFLVTELAKVEVPLNSIWLQNLAKKGSEFFSVAKGITSKSPNLANWPTKKNSVLGTALAALHVLPLWTCLCCTADNQHNLPACGTRQHRWTDTGPHRHHQLGPTQRP